MPEINDQYLRNQVFLEGLKAQYHKEFDRVLAELNDLIVGRLRQSDTIDTKRELNRMLADIKAGQYGIYEEYNESLLSVIEELAIDQADFEFEGLNAILGGAANNIPIDSSVLGALRANPIQIENYNNEPLLKSFIRDLTDDQVGMVQTRIRQGYAQGQTTDQIARAIRGTRAQNFRNGDLARVKRSNRALVFTTLQHASTQGRMSTMKANSDVLTGYEWLSTLDGNTTRVCRSLDGNVYQFGNGPLPPIHVNCRSTIIPKVDKRYSLLSDIDSGRPSVGSTGAKEVSGKETYYSWLKKQPVAFQNSAIGPEYGKLFRDGGLSSEEFASLQLDKNFRPLTLKEMRAKRPEVFERAGL